MKTKPPKETRTVKLKLKISAGERRSTISRMISWGNPELAIVVEVLAFVEVPSISISISSYPQDLVRAPSGIWRRVLRHRRRSDLGLSLELGFVNDVLEW